MYKVFSNAAKVLGSLGFMFAVSATWANDGSDSLRDLANDESALQQGKKLYQQVCASCHARDLSGSVGFNLKDGEWVHGEAPTKILSNIKKGFMNAGMPGFGSVYTEPQLKSIVAYILSEREGFADLSYKIYAMETPEDKVVTSEKLIKSGELPNNFADFRLPEVENYRIEFEGDFYAPRDEVSKIWAQWGKPLDIVVEVDGEAVAKGGNPWVPTWTLKPGKQRLKLIYHSGTNRPNQRDLILIVTNEDMSIKLFPISTRARQAMSDNKIEIIATGKTVVQRKKVLGVPSYSVSVGTPNNINYAFNTRTCSVVAMWQGDMLNVGPNVSGRGQDGSLVLGEFLFKHPQTLDVATGSDGKCRYQGYKMQSGDPIFTYKLNDTQYTLTPIAVSNKQIDFTYTIEANEMLNLNLPFGEGFEWFVSDQRADVEYLQVSPDSSGKLTVSARLD